MVRLVSPTALALRAALSSPATGLTHAIERRLFVLTTTLDRVAGFCRGFSESDRQTVSADFVAQVAAVAEVLAQEARQCSTDFETLRNGGAR